MVIPNWIIQKLLHLRMSCTCFIWNWPNGSEAAELSMYFYLLAIISPLKTGNFLCSETSLDEIMKLSSNFGENSEMLSMNFHNSITIPRRWLWHFIWINLNPIYPEMLYAKFDWNWFSGSDERAKNVILKISTERQTDRQFGSENLITNPCETRNVSETYMPPMV